jgi:hypothetical protein
MGKFVRVYRPKDDKEILFNTDYIWKIEVFYAIPKQGGPAWKVGLEEGMRNPQAIRIYEIYTGGEKITLFSNSDDPVLKVIEDIYNNAIKGPGSNQAKADV